MRYDDRNSLVIGGLHPAMQHKVWHALEELEMIGEDCLLTSGHRTLKEQQNEWDKGRKTPGKIVTHARPGFSFHNFGLAIDVVPIGPLGVELSRKNLLEWTALKRYEVYARIFQAMGFQWGFAMWGFDRPHFQYSIGLDGHPLSIGAIREGLRPDIEQARQERREALLERLEIAKNAIPKPWIKIARKRALERFIKNMEKRLQEI